MANYLEVNTNCTVTVGNETEDFIVGELVHPYSQWADPLLAAGYVGDSGQAAPNLAGTSPFPYVVPTTRDIPIKEVASTTYTFRWGDSGHEVHGTADVAQTFTIPHNNNERFAIGTFFYVRRMGLGTLTVNGQTDVIIHAPYGAAPEARYVGLRVIKFDQNEWVVLPDSGTGGGGGTGTDDQTASEVPFTPTGAISATNVQSALAELDTEKETPAGAQSKADAAQAAAEATAAGLYQPTSEKGVGNGYAGLNSFGKVPPEQLTARALTTVNLVADIAARDALSSGLLVQESDLARVADIGDGTSAWYVYDASGNWQNISSGGAGSSIASDVTLTPTGDVQATNVQAGIAELATEKQAISAKGAANGYASLDASSKVPSAQIPTPTTINGGTP